MKREYLDEYKPGLLVFGLGGHHVQTFPWKQKCSPWNGEPNDRWLKYGQGSISGYENPESFVARFQNPRDGCSDDAPGFYEGCPVIDKREVLKKNSALAIISPMCGLLLDEEEVDECPTPSAMFAGAVADNGFGALLRVQKTCKTVAPKQPGSLDSISVTKYVEWWRSRGARVGVIRNDVIVWED